LAAFRCSVGVLVVANEPFEHPLLSVRERTTLLVSVLIISICAITYELIIATFSSYLLGDSITQFSFTIGLFLFAMGLGSLLSRRITANELRWFVLVEIIIGLIGGCSALLLYAVFATTDLYYYTVMITIILIIGLCSGLEIPLLTRVVASRTALSKALADVLSMDYLGALIASLAFPILLLPLLGVTLTAFLTGLFNVAIAGLNLFQFRAWISIDWTRRLWAATITAALIMVAGFFFSASITDFFEQQLYEDHVIYRQQSAYQRIVITRNDQDIRLFINGDLQFSSRDEYRYHELLVHPVMSAARSHERVAVLGGGDGLVVRELLKYDDIQEIVLVDLDPAITDLALDFPLLRELNDSALDDPRVRIINQDAYKFILEGSDLFEVIIIDLPDPNNESLSKLYSEQFYRLLHKRLTPDGAFVTQATSPYFAREAFWCIAATVETSGFHMLPLHTYVPSFGEWGFVIGAPNRPPDVKIISGVSLRYLTADLLKAALYFDPDTARIPVDVNTLDNPVLMRYYERGWRYWD